MAADESKQQNFQTKSVIELRSISLQVNLQREQTSGADSAETSQADGRTQIESIESFLAIAQRFTTVLQLLWTYAHSVGTIAERTSLTNFATVAVLLKALKEREEKALENEAVLGELLFCITVAQKDGSEKEVKRKQRIFEHEHLKRITDCLKYHDAALDILNDTVLQQIVNAWENCQGALVSWHFNTSQDSIRQDESLTFREIMKFDEFDDVKRYVIDQQVDQFLKRKDTIEQLKYLKDTMGADLSSHFEKKKELAEIVLRRHVVVHANGFVSAEYIRGAEKLDSKFVTGLKIGDSIRPSGAYIRTSWSIIYAGGVILMHLISKMSARQQKSEVDEKRADALLTDASFTCIKEEQYDAAAMILSYACKHHLKSEQSKLIATVNYAQTLKWMGKDDDCESVLKSHDWSTCNNLFQLCVAAIRDDIQAFNGILPKVAATNELKVNEVYEWPAFKMMRAKPDFDSWVQKAYNMTLPKELQDTRPKLLNRDMVNSCG